MKDSLNIKVATQVFHQLKADIENALQLTRDESPVLNQQFDTLIEAFKNGDFLSSYFDKLRLDFLLHKINSVKAKNLRAFNKIKKDMVLQKDNDGFYSFRFELDVAFSLSDKNIDYIASEKPDFLVDDITIECTSVRSKGGNKDNLIKKTLDAMQSKEGKPYANSKCALFIDSTNIYFNINPDDWQLSLEEQHEILRSNMKHDKYGSILVFTTFFSQKDFNITTHYDRIDSNQIDSNLKEFLDLNYPVARGIVSGPGTPKET